MPDGNLIPWDEIKQEYISGNYSLRALADKYGISKASVFNYSTADKWVEAKSVFKARVGQQALARIEAAAVNDRVRIYDATREATDNLVSALLQASKDAKALHRHLIQIEDGRIESGFPIKSKWVEDRVFDRIDGRNAADIARAIKDLASMARVLDGIVDASSREKLDIEREKLELDKRRAGLSDDIEQESGIAIMPAVDESLLDKALPDPDQAENQAQDGGKT